MLRQATTIPSTHSARPLWVSIFTALACLFVLAGPAHAELAVHVRGNQLVNAEGRSIRLLGVNFSGAEYACIQDRGIWSAPTDEAAIAAMVAWHIDAVRIPLNEDCWLGIDGAPTAYSGSAYQQAIHEFVQALHDAGLYVILDLQWSAPGANQATGLQQMADAEHSVEFWSSVAQSFREDPAVLFDLYSEPHEISWECWLEGCTLPWSGGGTWQTAGMQSLVDAVRSEGATQPLLLGGIEWANDLSGWLTHLPEDPQHQLVASIHVYSNKTCSSATCWAETLAPIAERYPVVAGEVGEFDCEDHFIDQFMNWADANDVSYLGWTWNTFDCASGPALIANTDGTPTAFGQGLLERLRTSRTTLEASPSPAAAGAPVILTVQVSSPTATASPTGNVTFQVDGEDLATQPLDTAGQATLSLPRLSVGAHKLRVLYGGDEALEAGTSEAQTVEVLSAEPPPAPPIAPPIVSPPSSNPQLAAPPTPVAVAPVAVPAVAAATSKPAPVHRASPRRASPHRVRRSARRATRGQCSRASHARARGARARLLRARCTPSAGRARAHTQATSPSRNANATRGR
jgi:Cellulase (glycosyl hydrolase family 5)/Bacterial Ig-like domain (group 3)